MSDNQRKVLITGVSSGLGRALAESQLQAGREVWGCSRRVPEELVEKGLRHLELDLSDEMGAAPLRAWLPEGAVWDLVILNAARLGEIRDMADTPLSDLRLTMEVNVWSQKWTLDALFDRSAVVRQVVAISSGASQSGNRGWNGYGISKAAMNMLMALYAAERPDTHFTALAPGLVETAMQDYLGGLPDDPRFSTVARLKQARGTSDMPDAATCAGILEEVFPKLLRRENGSFVDIRRM